MQLSLTSFAVKNLQKKSFRSSILVLSIGLLVTILVFGTSFLISVTSTLERSADRLGADVLVVPVGARDYAEEMLLETKSKVFYMDRSIMERVRQVEGVAQVTDQTYLTTVTGMCCDIPPTTVVSFNQDSDFIVTAWLDRAIGRKLQKGEAIIGHEANENLGLLDISRSLMFGVEFTIVGVLEKTGTGLDNAMFMSDENIEQILSRGEAGLKPNEISLIFVKVKPGYEPLAVSRSIEGAIMEVDTIERSDMGKRIVTSLHDIRNVFLVTILLAALLASFLAWTVFSAIVSERAREVGIMKAIGAKGSHIVTMFTIEVLILGVMGSIFGIGFGTYLSMALSHFFSLLQELSVALTLLERMGIGVSGLLAGTGICLVGALSSIIRLKNIEPYTAIKEA